MLNYNPPFPNGNLLLCCFNFSSLSSALAAIFCNRIPGHATEQFSIALSPFYMTFYMALSFYGCPFL